jgi:hypothetical protein
VGFVVNKVALGQVSPANSYSIDCSTILVTIIVIVMIIIIMG